MLSPSEWAAAYVPTMTTTATTTASTEEILFIDTVSGLQTVGPRKSGKTKMGMAHEEWARAQKVPLVRDCLICRGTGDLRVRGWFGRSVLRPCAECEGEGTVVVLVPLANVLPPPRQPSLGAFRSGVAGSDIGVGQAVYYDSATGTLKAAKAAEKVVKKKSKKKKAKRKGR